MSDVPRTYPPSIGAKFLRTMTACAAAFLLPFSILAEDPPTAPPDAKPDADVAEVNWTKEREFWSFRPPQRQPRPVVKNRSWPSEPLDYFVLARLEQNNVAPTREATKRTLVRRVTFDLTGLPPTPEEVEAFLQDNRPNAYGLLVERLLASPRFGERMASMWLPLARYAEDQAHQVGDDTKFFYPNAYHYREWVIDAFNRDLPYDQFVKLQLAADKFLAPPPAAPTPEQTNAASSLSSSQEAGISRTLGTAPLLAKAQGASPEAGDQNAIEQLAVSQSDLAALGFLGLGPKYYNRNRIEVQADEWEDRVDTVTRTLLGLTVACARCHDHKFDPITAGDYYALAGVFASTKMVNKRADGKTEKEDKAEKVSTDTVHVVEDGNPQNLNVFIRGNPERKGPVVERRFLRVLSPGDPVPFKEGSGRKELAAAIASRGNPLTARVAVNRVWGLFFGRPLVVTPSNFGHSGQLPSHPELLDDLAARFMENGWSVKSFVREIVFSSTYRQSSVAATEAIASSDTASKRTTAFATGAAVDPANDLLWRMNRRRLPVEQWRDAVLFVSGDLEGTGGKSLEVDAPANHRRTVYSRVSRLKLNDVLMQFDYPDANVHAEKRSITTTAIQKLFLLNSPFILGQAKILATRLTADPNENDAARVGRAYRLLFGRDPESAELKLATEFLNKPATPEMPRWEQYAQLLLASNEMVYVD